MPRIDGPAKIIMDRDEAGKAIAETALAASLAFIEREGMSVGEARSSLLTNAAAFVCQDVIAAAMHGQPKDVASEIAHAVLAQVVAAFHAKTFCCVPHLMESLTAHLQLTANMVLYHRRVEDGADTIGDCAGSA